MKAEHRKELETNSLSAAIASWIESARTGPTNGLMIFLVLVAVVVGLIVLWRYYAVTAVQASSALWMKVDNASTAEELLKVAESEASSGAARAARFEASRMLLRQGLDKSLSILDSERETAWKDLKSAEEQYEKLSKELSGQPILVQEALFGLAKAREGQGNIDGALEAYEKLSKRYGDTALGKLATESKKKLEDNRKEAEAFYAKLREIAPPPSSKPTSETPEK